MRGHASIDGEIGKTGVLTICFSTGLIKSRDTDKTRARVFHQGYGYSGTLLKAGYMGATDSLSENEIGLANGVGPYMLKNSLDVGL